MSRVLRLIVLMGLLALGTACGEAEPTPHESKPAPVSEIDPNDPRTALDLRTVDASISKNRVTFDVHTYRAWDLATLSRPNKMRIYIYTYPRHDLYSRLLNVTFFDGRIHCELYYNDGDFIEEVQASRPDGSRSVSCVVPTKHMPNVKKHLRWVGETKALRPNTAIGRPRKTDRAPDSGFFGAQESLSAG